MLTMAYPALSLYVFLDSWSRSSKTSFVKVTTSMAPTAQLWHYPQVMRAIRMAQARSLNHQNSLSIVAWAGWFAKDTLRLVAKHVAVKTIETSL